MEYRGQVPAYGSLQGPKRREGEKKRWDYIAYTDLDHEMWPHLNSDRNLPLK